jgi:hypothetical protein
MFEREREDNRKKGKGEFFLFHWVIRIVSDNWLTPFCHGLDTKNNSGKKERKNDRKKERKKETRYKESQKHRETRYLI